MWFPPPGHDHEISSCGCHHLAKTTHMLGFLISTSFPSPHLKDHFNNMHELGMPEGKIYVSLSE